ncbi:DUF916 domain-containing protein [Carnobacterium maltaromaticum]|uniref:DUF916 domain-containing protein n=1 Tax=Carnobacterium maltaromaticum TaxID=2751 RepID=UPI00295E52CB|nr:DUF916 domain-containing protein [Carnobacterium maltaromaticum]
MKKAKILFFILVPIISFYFLDVNYVNATETDFSVEIKPPENQIDKNNTYFDLMVNPEEKQLLEVVLTNKTEKEIAVDVRVTNARSTMTGLIDYSPMENKDDKSLKYNMKNLVKNKSKEAIIVPGRGSSIVQLQMELPKDLQEGIILGGIDFRLKDEGKNEIRSKGANVGNVYAIVKGIQLHNGVLPLPKINLSQARVVKFKKNPTIVVNYQNSEAVSVFKMKTHTIIKDDNGKVFLEDEKTDLQMAPNSNVDFPTEWKESAMASGSYVAEVTATIGEKKWTEKLPFTVTPKDSKETKSSPSEVRVEEKDNRILYVILFLMSILIVGLSIYLVVMRKTKNDKE